MAFSFLLLFSLLTIDRILLRFLLLFHFPADLTLISWVDKAKRGQLPFS